MSIMLVNDVPCEVHAVDAQSSPEATVEEFLTGVERAAMTASFEYGDILRKEDPSKNPFDSVRNLIVDIRESGLDETIIREQIPGLRTKINGLLDWLRVIGDGFDLSIQMWTPERKQTPAPWKLSEVREGSSRIFSQVIPVDMDPQAR